MGSSHIACPPQTGSRPAMNPPRVVQGKPQPRPWPLSSTLGGANVNAEGSTWAAQTSAFLVPHHQPGSATVPSWLSVSCCAARERASSVLPTAPVAPEPFEVVRWRCRRLRRESSHCATLQRFAPGVPVPSCAPASRRRGLSLCYPAVKSVFWAPILMLAVPR